MSETINSCRIIRDVDNTTTLTKATQSHVHYCDPRGGGGDLDGTSSSDAGSHRPRKEERDPKKPHSDTTDSVRGRFSNTKDTARGRASKKSTNSIGILYRGSSLCESDERENRRDWLWKVATTGFVFILFWKGPQIQVLGSGLCKLPYNDNGKHSV